MTRTTTGSEEPTWFKSSYSSSSEGDSCVEIATAHATVHVRDSKHRDIVGPRLALAPQAWAVFVTALRA
ncbi:DUF397 domain-containing protein [Streptomyces sp. NPDC023723]|uniref:DUF397 domain-containing protein n=1 Tax=Streptomyces sp. NPDC023723 TaxID=3154323 RepID=UPI0033DC3234